MNHPYCSLGLRRGKRLFHFMRQRINQQRLYSTKELKFGQDVRSSLLNGVEVLAKGFYMVIYYFLYL